MRIFTLKREVNKKECRHLSDKHSDGSGTGKIVRYT